MMKKQINIGDVSITATLKEQVPLLLPPFYETLKQIEVSQLLKVI